MRKVIVVDDETIIRVTIRGVINWEELGFTIEADFHNPIQALEYMKNHHVDLLITDMKMPEMTGNQLLETIRVERIPVISLVLSGYNEFDMVRAAFRAGAADYILKSDLTKERFETVLKDLNEKYFGESERQHTDKERKVDALEEGTYAVILLQIDHFSAQIGRFGNDLKENLEKPMLELARQISRISLRGKIKALYPSSYLLLYKVHNFVEEKQTLISVTRQLQSVWSDYMNLSVSAAVAGPATQETETINQNIDAASELLSLGVLEGESSITTIWEHGHLIEKKTAAEQKFKKFIMNLYMEEELEEEKNNLFAVLNSLDLESAKELVLLIIVNLANKFREYDDDFFGMFPESVNYYEKVNRLESHRELGQWLGNYCRWVTNYLGNRSASRQTDVIWKARHFVNDNYGNPELTLHLVADFAGLNEKYFSSRFTKETGMTFSSYVLKVRMSKAKKLMDTTELKMYEISERVGYHNVEHFSRMFKRECGTSPIEYKKKRHQ